MTRHAMVTPKPLILAVPGRRGVRRLGEMWAALSRTLALWRHRARTRAELGLIPGHQLNDLPFDTSAAVNERAKPFWRQ